MLVDPQEFLEKSRLVDLRDALAESACTCERASRSKGDG
jgi:hypothetical protein